MASSVCTSQGAASLLGRSIPTDYTGSQGLGLIGLGLTWTFTGLAVVVVAARLTVRQRTSKRWSADDWSMLLALLLQIVYEAMFTVQVYWGFGLPYDRISAEQFKQSNKWSWYSAGPSILASFIARISITILLVRIFGVQTWLKWYLICFTSLLTVVSVVSIVLLFAQCIPWYGLWEYTIKARRLNPLIYAYTALASQFLYAISDLTFVLFPVLIIWRLNMPRRRKFALAALLGLSLITMGIVVTKIVLVLIRLTRPDDIVAIHYQSLVQLIASLEQCLVIIMGCIPTLRLSKHIKLPTLGDMGSWVFSMLPTVWSSKSRQESSYRSGGQSSDQDLELVPKLRIPNDSKPYTVTLSGNASEYQDLPRTKDQQNSIMHQTEFSVEHI
ncbi:hypothetical protein F4782DRAFT_522182 [Xylaria castorea]|nr:hypothetical protein F4782DRAFT_522182 [Xylaria castorea]